MLGDSVLLVYLYEVDATSTHVSALYKILASPHSFSELHKVAACCWSKTPIKTKNDDK